MSNVGLEKFKEVPLNAKIWLSAYERPGFLVSADVENNRFVLSLPPHWTQKTFYYDEKQDKLLEYLPAPEPIKITLERATQLEICDKCGDEGCKREVEPAKNEILYPERT